MSKYSIYIYTYDTTTASYSISATYNYNLQKNIVDFLNNPHNYFSTFKGLDQVVVTDNYTNTVLYIVDTLQHKYYFNVSGVLHRTLEVFISKQTRQLSKHGYTFSNDL